jgi:hypothetical protein
VGISENMREFLMTVCVYYGASDLPDDGRNFLLLPGVKAGLREIVHSIGAEAPIHPEKTRASTLDHYGIDSSFGFRN